MRKKKRNYLEIILMLTALSLIFISTSTAVAQCPVDITSLWTLDESSGSFIADAFNGNNGTGAANPQPTTEGIVNGAQIFNGNTTGINIPADNSLNWDKDSSFSIEYWVKRADSMFGDNEVVVGKDDASSQLHLWTGLWTDGTASFVLISTNGDGGGSRATGEWLEGFDDLTDGEWHHVVAVRDGDAEENRLYVDGVLNDSFTINYGAGFDSATAALNLGWLNLPGGFYFEGTLDEIAIYDRVLSPQEISDHYNDGAGESYCGTLARYELTTIVAGSGSGSVNPPGGVYNMNRTLEIAPVPDVGSAFNGWSGDLSGYSDPDTLAMNADKSVTVKFDTDADADGASDAEEDAGSNGGDGNSDNIPDSTQAYVVTFHIDYAQNDDPDNYVTLEVDNLFTLANCRAITPPTSGAPTGIDFSYGFFAFDIGLTNPANSPQVKLFLPAGANPSTYYRFGPTPADNSDHWYEFLFDGQTGADISGNPIIIDFANGVRGDDDLDDTNLVIKDAGGPGFPAPQPKGGGGGGGCFISTATDEFYFSKVSLTLMILFNSLLIGFIKFREKQKK